MPQISVLMPVYNSEEVFLREAIESILQQTFSDFEFVIVNDGSTNNAEDVILSYSDSRIKYITQQNQGVARALNFGLSQCTGKYVARMDSDDIAMPNRFEKQIEYMEAHPEVSILGSAMEHFPQKCVIFLAETDIEIKDYMTWIGSPVPHPTVMIRREFLVKNNLSYPNCCIEDFALWLKCKHLCNFHNLREVLLKYRIHEAQTTQQKMQKMIEKTHRLMIPVQKRDFGFSLESLYSLGNDLRANISPKQEDVQTFYLNFHSMEPIFQKYPGLFTEAREVWRMLLRQYKYVPRKIFLDRRINRFFGTSKSKYARLLIKSIFI